MRVVDMTSQHGMCARCGREADGRRYALHYGWKTDQSSTSTSLGVATVTKTSTTYRIGGSEDPFLCNRCVRRLNLPMNILAFSIVLILGLVLCSAPMPWFIGGLVLLLAAVGLLISIFSTNVSVSDGEQAVCRFARKQHLHGTGAVYWTPKEYAKLKPKL